MRQPPARTTALRRTMVQSNPTDAVTLWVIERATTTGNRLVRDPARADAPNSGCGLDLVFLGTSGSVPTAKRGLAGTLLRRGEADPRRLRRGHAAPAAALLRRARRAARDLPDALPRRPLPRPAGDAEDVRSPGPRGAADRLRARGPQGSLRDPPARVRAAELRAPSSSCGRERASRGRTTGSRRSPWSTASRPTATRSSRSRARAASTSRPRRSRRPGGPRCSDACRREAVQLPDGATVSPGEVLGPARPGRKVVLAGDTRAPARCSRQPERPTSSSMKRRSRSRSASAREETLHATATSAAELALGSRSTPARAHPPFEPLLRARDRPRGARGLPGDRRSEGLRYHRCPLPGAGWAPAREGRGVGPARGGGAA